MFATVEDFDLKRVQTARTVGLAFLEGEFRKFDDALSYVMLESPSYFNVMRYLGSFSNAIRASLFLSVCLSVCLP